MSYTLEVCNSRSVLLSSFSIFFYSQTSKKRTVLLSIYLLRRRICIKKHFYATLTFKCTPNIFSIFILFLIFVQYNCFLFDFTSKGKCCATKILLCYEMLGTEPILFLVSTFCTCFQKIFRIPIDM